MQHKGDALNKRMLACKSLSGANPATSRIRSSRAFVEAAQMRVSLAEVAAA